MRTVTIIQARMGSSRLPGKVLLDIAGKPMIQHVIERTRQARSSDMVIVATTLDPADDPVAAFCEQMGVICSRGSLHDVLDRYYQAAKSQQADIVTRITADCPLIDPLLIDQTVALVKEKRSAPVDFACNRLPPPYKRSFPIGLDVEVCTFDALQRAWFESNELFHREHVMPFIYQDVQLEPSAADAHITRGNSPRGFKIALLDHIPDYGSLRWTVDTPEDLAFIREIFARLSDKAGFTWYDVLRIIQNEPQLAQINAAVHHKSMTDVDPRAAD